jgi:hypothetical protein
VNEFLDEFVILGSTTQHQPLVLKKFVSESDRFSTVKWISSNRIACGYNSGVLQILEVKNNGVKMWKGHGVNETYISHFRFYIILGIFIHSLTFNGRNWCALLHGTKNRNF